MDDAWDCHLHLYADDARWSGCHCAVAKGDLCAYRPLQAALGTSRVVVVQPLLYASDNSYLLGMLGQLGEGARGVAIAPASISDMELDALNQAGVAGLRFFAGSALTGAAAPDVSLAQMRLLDARLSARGMHFQVNTNGRFLARQPHAFDGFSSPIVFDHLGHVLPIPGGYEGLDALLRLLEKGNAWVKLSGIYLDSRELKSGCEDMRVAVQRLADARADRLVWGTNWPHPTVRAGEQIPDDAQLMHRVRYWLPGKAERHGVFVENPARLYGGHGRRV